MAVEQVSELKRKRLRQMEITFDSAMPASEFDLPGVRDVVQIKNTLRFLVEEAPGVVDRIVKKAAQYSVVDIKVTQATLEDIFLAYYRKEGTDAAA